MSRGRATGRSSSPSEVAKLAVCWQAPEARLSCAAHPIAHPLTGGSAVTAAIPRDGPSALRMRGGMQAADSDARERVCEDGGAPARENGGAGCQTLAHLSCIGGGIAPALPSQHCKLRTTPGRGGCGRPHQH